MRFHSSQARTPSCSRSPWNAHPARYSADRRWPVDNSTSSYNVAVQQVRASSTRSGAPPSPSTTSAQPALNGEELTILTAWAEAVSEAAHYTPQRLDALLAEARPEGPWRAELGLAQPSRRLSDALESLERLVHAARNPAGTAPFDDLLTRASEDPPEEGTLDRLVRRVLLAMLEERATRQAGNAKRTL